MIAIRKATKDDAINVHEIKTRAILHGCAGYYSVEDLDVWLDKTVSKGFIDEVEHFFHVAEVEGQVVGTGKLDAKTGQVHAVFVEPDFMGCGIATKMMRYLENLAIESGLTILQLEATLNAVSFYHKLNFVGDEISKYCSSSGVSIDCVPMTKKIKT